MASQNKVPPTRAGKTLKKPEEKPEGPETSGEELTSEEESERGSQQGTQKYEENLSQTPLSTFHAAPPARDIVDTVAAEDLSVDLVKGYTDRELKQVHILELRWDTTQSWGQIRRLNKDLVERYVRSLEKEELRQPIRVLLRDLGSGISQFNPDRTNLLFVPQEVSMLFWVANTFQQRCGQSMTRRSVSGAYKNQIYRYPKCLCTQRFSELTLQFQWHKLQPANTSGIRPM